MRRILALPRGVQVEPSPLIQKWAPKLRSVQIEALATAEALPAPMGIFGDISVGGGKFLISLLLPRVLGIKRAVVFTNPELIAQSARETSRWTEAFPEILGYVPRFVSYAKLSHPDSADLLRELSPALIIADEAHTLCGRGNARTLRIVDYMVKSPMVRFCAMSGSFARKSVRDLQHLAELCLRDGAWVPLSKDVIQQWAEVLDYGAVPSAEQTARLAPLMRWAGKDDPLDAYRERYRSTPGVVIAETCGVPSGLTVEMPTMQAPPEIENALETLRETWNLPDGTELVDALEFARHSATLAVGFYYRPIFPTGEEAREHVRTWMDTRREWQRALNTQINYMRWSGLDSPARVEAACEAGRAHPDTLAAYAKWVGIRDSWEPSSEVVWLTRAVVEGAVRHLRRRGRGLLWYQSRAIEQALEEAGLPVFGAGTDAPSDRIDVAALSIRSHGTGKNLQAWSYNLVLEPPAGATAWEQLIGRTHRPGQTADTTEIEVFCAAWPSKSRLLSALKEAEHLHAKTGQPQKLLLATWL